MNVQIKAPVNVVQAHFDVFLRIAQSGHDITIVDDQGGNTVLTACVLGKSKTTIVELDEHDRNECEFNDYILSEIIAQGFLKSDFAQAFFRRKEEVLQALELLTELSKNIAKDLGEYYTYNELYGIDTPHE